MSFDPNVPDDAAPLPPEGDAVRERVQMPALFLIVIGVLNLLGGGYWLFNGIVALRTPVEEIKKQMAAGNPQSAAQLQQMKQMGWSLETIMAVTSYGFIGVGAGGILLALLTILGGVRMMQLRSYGLAILAALVAAVPLLSTSACCCLGEAVGLWALIVLLNGDVRSAFR
jgi:hypothetical protein